MNLRKVLLTFLMFASASIAFAPKTTAQNTINRDSLPDDAIVVKRVPLESGPALESKEDFNEKAWILAKENRGENVDQ